MMAAVLTLMLATAALDARGQVDRGQAERLARTGAHREAIAAFEEIVAAHPEDVEARLWLGRLYTWTGQRARAEGMYRAVLAGHPRDVYALVGLGSLMVTEGRANEGLDLLQTAEAEAPENSDVLGALGRAWRLAGDLPRSIEYFERAVQIAPQDRGNVLSLQRARRQYAQWVGVAGEFESSSQEGVPDGGFGALQIALRATRRLRLRGGAQVHNRSGQTEGRAGGGIDWQFHPSANLTVVALAGPGADILARTDVEARTEWYRGRWMYESTIRWLDYASSRAAVVLAGATLYVNERLSLNGRVGGSHTTFDSGAPDAVDPSALVRARWAATDRITVDATYAYGVESYDRLTADRLGQLKANTGAAGVEMHLPTLSTIGAALVVERRTGNQTIVRLTATTIWRF